MREKLFTTDAGPDRDLTLGPAGLFAITLAAWSTQSLQMYTPAPATKVSTSLLCRLQNEHRFMPISPCQALPHMEGVPDKIAAPGVPTHMRDPRSRSRRHFAAKCQCLTGVCRRQCHARLPGGLLSDLLVMPVSGRSALKFRVMMLV